MPERERRDRRRLRALAGFWRVAGSPQGSSEREAPDRDQDQVKKRREQPGRGARRASFDSFAGETVLRLDRVSIM